MRTLDDAVAAAAEQEEGAGSHAPLHRPWHARWPTRPPRPWPSARPSPRGVCRLACGWRGAPWRARRASCRARAAPPYLDRVRERGERGREGEGRAVGVGDGERRGRGRVRRGELDDLRSRPNASMSRRPRDAAARASLERAERTSPSNAHSPFLARYVASTSQSASDRVTPARHRAPSLSRKVRSVYRRERAVGCRSGRRGVRVEAAFCGRGCCVRSSTARTHSARRDRRRRARELQ